MERHGVILWDVDGTLVDSHALCIASTNAVLIANGGQPVSEKEYHQGTRYTTPTRMAWHYTGNPNDSCGEKLGREFDLVYLSQVSSETVVLYDGIQKIFQSFQTQSNISMGLLSNANIAYVNAVANLYPFIGLSTKSCQYGADTVNAPKPYPNGLWQALQSMKLIPENEFEEVLLTNDSNLIKQLLEKYMIDVVYIGDSPSDGIAAKAAGFQSIGVTWGSHVEETLAPVFDVLVHSTADLYRLLESRYK